MNRNITNKNNTEKRKRYLESMLNKLCVILGPRPAGSENYNESVNIIKNELEKCVRLVEIDHFVFDYWELKEKPRLICETKELEVWPYYGSKDTSEKGIDGKIKKIKAKEPVFGLYDKNLRKIQAYITISPFGKAVPRFAWEPEFKMVPAVTVGRQDQKALERAISQEARVNLKFKAETIKNKESYSVIGYLPGESKDEILFLAHADTHSNTPGANDNTASLITMFMIACELSKTKHKYSITFAATGGEEVGHLGAAHYAETRKNRGDIHRIKISINFDSLTYGPNMIIYSKDKELSSLITKIYKELKLKGTIQVISENDTLDGEVFIKAGARGIYVNSRGYDKTKLKLWHRPEDLPGSVDFELAENGFLVFTELIKQIEDRNLI